MKNSEIHKGLEKDVIRDFLSKEYHTAQAISFGESSEYLQTKIEELQKRLEAAKKKEGIKALFNSLGWYIFDVSDDIDDFNAETYFDFIGNDREYDKMMQKASQNE